MNHDAPLTRTSRRATQSQTSPAVTGLEALKDRKAAERLASWLAGERVQHPLPEAPVVPPTPRAMTETLVAASQPPYDPSADIASDTDMYTAAEGRYRALRSAIPNSLVAVFSHDLRLLASVTDDQISPPRPRNLRVSPAALLTHLAPQAQQALSGQPANVNITLRRESDMQSSGVDAARPPLRTIRASAVPVRDEEGQVVAGLLLAQDTTEQERVSRQLQDVVDGVGAFVWEYDRTRQRHTFVSDGAVDLLGYPVQQWLETPHFWETVLPVDEAARMSAQIATLHPDERLVLEHRLIAIDGSLHWMRTTIVLGSESGNSNSNGNGHSTSNGNGHAYTTIRGLTVDITDRQVAESARQAAEERYRALVEQLPGVVYRVELDPEHPIIEMRDSRGQVQRQGHRLRLRYVSPQIATLTGFSDEGWSVAAWERNLLPADRDRVLEQIQDAVRQNHPWTLEYRLLTRDGRTIWVRDEATLVQDEPGGDSDGGVIRDLSSIVQEPERYWQGMLTNITERKELESQLAHRAYHDVVTGLPNRAMLLDNLQRALAAAQRRNRTLAVLFLDLDNFKSINDVFGHASGDNLLRDVARRLETCVRAEDTAARIGGDEFAVLLPNIDGPEVAIDVARRILDTLALPLTVHAHDQAAVVTASIGIALGGQAGDTPDDLLRHADMAMYRAKSAGKNRYDLYDGTLQTATLERIEMEVELQRALDLGELVMHYQPFVSLPDHRIVGVEALVRWQHPRRGLLQAAEFLASAEESGLIIPLGRWALAEACRQVASWRTEHPTTNEHQRPLMVGVNLSTAEFHDPGLLEHVRAVLEGTNLPPGALILEITEATLMTDADRSITTLQQLAEIGVRAAIDDFGLTYASMARLSRFPLAYLQIGRRFVDNLSDDLDATVIVSGMIGLAHALRLEAIAEGVESAGPAGRLVELYCDMAQGHYYAHPLPAHEMQALLAEPSNPRLGHSTLPPTNVTIDTIDPSPATDAQTARERIHDAAAAAPDDEPQLAVDEITILVADDELNTDPPTPAGTSARTTPTTPTGPRDDSW